MGGYNFWRLVPTDVREGVVRLFHDRPGQLRANTSEAMCPLGAAFQQMGIPASALPNAFEASAVLAKLRGVGPAADLIPDIEDFMYRNDEQEFPSLAHAVCLYDDLKAERTSEADAAVAEALNIVRDHAKTPA